MNCFGKDDVFMFKGVASPSRYNQCCRSPNNLLIGVFFERLESGLQSRTGIQES